MNDDKAEEYYLKDVFGKIKSFSYVVLKHWLIVGIIVALSIGAGLYYYYTQKPKYEAYATFLLEGKSGSALGSFSGLASQFGFDLGGASGGNSNLFAGDNILDILKSRIIVEKVLLSKVDSNSNKKLADLYIESFSKGKRDKEIVSYENVRQKEELSLLQDSVLFLMFKKLITGSISVDRMNKKGTIFSITVTTLNQKLSKLLTERLVDEALNLYVKIKIGNTQANIAKLEQRADSLLHSLNSKTFQTASLNILDVNPAIKTAPVPMELSNRDKNLTATIYVEVVKNLEMSRIVLSQQTPVIQKLDQPSFPLVMKKARFIYCMLIAAFLGALISLGYVLLLYIRSDVK